MTVKLCNQGARSMLYEEAQPLPFKVNVCVFRVDGSLHPHPLQLLFI